MAASAARHADSHAHLTMEPFDADREEVIARARDAGLAHVVTVSSLIGDAERCADLAARHDLIHFTAGVHPHDARAWSDEVARGVRRAAARPKAVAIGEIGLDYHYDRSPRPHQQRAFREQIGLARDLRLPIVVHTREAWEDTFRILEEERAGEMGGIFHCFSGGREEARRCLDLGFYLSFAGPVTFRKAEMLGEAAAYVPLERLLTETDAPYLSPHPFRGRRNEPARVVLVAEKIAELRGIAVGEVGEAAARNLEMVFRINSRSA
ncbi:MAG: TatD family hydrolase [Acidobacteriota bacterium]